MGPTIISNVKIAVVDSDPLTREFIVSVMMYSVNREVFSFENAAGLKTHLAAVGNLDLVMSEMNLPDGSGLELLDTVRKHNPGAVLVALSSRHADENEARRCGIDGFLAKPFALNDLFAIVQRFIVEDVT